MSISLEQIGMLKDRANVSYEEAREVLEKCNCDVVEALIYLEKQDKVKTCKRAAIESGVHSTTKKVLSTAEKLFKKGNETKFVISKADKNIVDIPVNVVILATIIAPPVTIVGALGALVTKHKIRFAKPDGGEVGINEFLDKFATTVNKVNDQVAEAIK